MAREIEHLENLLYEAEKKGWEKVVIPTYVLRWVVEELSSEALWLEYQRDTFCGLCANSGFVNTLGNAIDYDGNHYGVYQPCICPNGRAIKRMNDA